MSIQCIINAAGANLSASFKQSSTWHYYTLTKKLLLLNLFGELRCLQFSAVNCIALFYVRSSSMRRTSGHCFMEAAV